MPDHVHILISIPPKYSVSQIVGYIKGKSAIYIARHYRGKERNFTGEKFWARGYFVSTVGSNYRNGANANYKDSFPYHNGNCIALSSPKINNLIHALNDKCNGSLS